MAKDKEHLVKYRFDSSQSRKKAAQNGRKGGIASGAARRKKKTMKEIALALGTQDAPPAVVAKLIQVGMLDAGESCSMDEALMLAQYGKALSGNTKAAQFVRDTSGQKPVDQVELSDISQAQHKLDELLEQRKRRNQNHEAE